MGPLWIANLAVISISLVIFILIMVSYLKSSMILHTKAFLGIMLFSMIFLIQSITAVIIYYNLSFSFGVTLASLLMIINVIGLLGYIVLYKALKT